MKHFSNIVLGGGVSSGYLAREWVRSNGPRNGLAIISGDKYVAYERPALSKAYLFPKDAPRLPGFHTCVGGGGERQEPSWYRDHGIAYFTDTVITEADLSQRRLTSTAGDVFTYDRLVIATGARATTLEDFHMPGGGLDNVCYLRDVSDADALLAAVARSKAAGNRAVVIGGGYIGMEVGAGLSLHGLDVTLVYPEGRLMERLLTPELAGFYENFYRGKGVHLMSGKMVAEVVGKDGKADSVRLKSGEVLPADMVLVGIGARPNIELFKGQVEMLSSAPGGIAVNGRLQTSVDGVFAVGDVAAFPTGTVDGKRSRQEHVTNARLMGKFVAGELLSLSQPEYSYLPFFYSREFSLSWQFYGESKGSAVHFGDHDAGKFGAYWVDNSHVVGVFLEGGSAEDNDAIKKVIEKNPAAPADLAQQGLKFALAL